MELLKYHHSSCYSCLPQLNTKDRVVLVVKAKGAGARTNISLARSSEFFYLINHNRGTTTIKVEDGAENKFSPFKKKYVKSFN